MPGGKHDVYILEVDGVFYARPAVAAVQGGVGKKLWVRNLTNREVTLKFPPGVVTPASFKVDPHDKKDVRIRPTADGIYDYSVLVRIASNIYAPALGNSGPKIIVDP
jgi:hypothetical protein